MLIMFLLIAFSYAPDAKEVLAGLRLMAENGGRAVIMSELNEWQTAFAITLVVITPDKDKIYEFNHRASREED
jgi:DNA-binding MurR/RpiR family transcriptional regulator